MVATSTGWYHHLCTLLHQHVSSPFIEFLFCMLQQVSSQAQKNRTRLAVWFRNFKKNCHQFPGLPNSVHWDPIAIYSSIHSQIQYGSPAMYACTNCNGRQLQFSLCNGLCRYRHLITFYLAIKGFSNASQAEQMWIWQTQFGRPETSSHMLILQ